LLGCPPRFWVLKATRRRAMGCPRYKVEGKTR
jgi:hypothetical protein